MGLLDFLFGNNTKKIQDFKNRDAVILDVRTRKEYDAGAISGSKHIPLNEINTKISEIKKWNKPVITCCASGVRSGNAAKTTILRWLMVVDGNHCKRNYNFILSRSASLSTG